ncbi:hypothetical protein [Zymobacter palmae]|nr:hypothetical protein [Zymobacter palmae]BBG31254.1 histidinol-phosphate/aromatic aminotransferase [Zymobacter palmae]
MIGGVSRWMLIGSAALLMAGCAHQWTRPGATPQMRQQELGACSAQAEQKFPVRNEMAIYSGYTMEYGFCNEAMMACFPGDPIRIVVPQVESHVVDVNEKSREHTVAQCMRAKGWQ